MDDCMFINEIHYNLVGIIPNFKVPFHGNLNIQLLSTECINNVHCIPIFPSNPLYGWSFGPEFSEPISERGQKMIGLPKLDLKIRIGSAWSWMEYQHIQDHLRAMNYVLDGKQYARNHGYPELIRGDPHDVQRELKADPIDSQVPHSDWTRFLEVVERSFDVPSGSGRDAGQDAHK
ncbi:hypothetical protein PM082_016607 [Marasmius tenuissimus]|nr:hypothetical protein PM082_016607 [Marasmius tenuissimus]